ncbi:MAG TPA: malectin domain-containing carbohydrate-binding protein [Bryobacteraceae bacterium]|jgi:hypothetical protein|nr:malectin domain-containing carbohydrate-binding protein [Bryobacteraceae bacterium]
MRSLVSPSVERERAALEAVLASERFARSPRLARLLAYLCQKSFDGEADQIKEYNIATEVLGRPVEFDPSQDAIARVEAHRLRKKLKEYYAEEGSGDEIRIVLLPGKYVPEFVRARHSSGNGCGQPSEAAFAEPTVVLPAEPEAISEPEPPAEPEPVRVASFLQIVETEQPPSPRRSWRRWLYWGLAACLALAVVPLWKLSRGHTVALAGASPRPLVSGIPSGYIDAQQPVRLLAGSSRSSHIDRMGNVWQADRYFSGGSTSECPHEFFARTNDPMLFASYRNGGEFSYSIPLAPGTYEMHLFFVETVYGPGLVTGGGENSRTFGVVLNGKLLLDNFDIVSDARGPNIADERVFRDVHPDKDGKLHLQFYSERGQAVVSAIEILPGLENRQLPIRLVAQENSVTDHLGHVFAPDTYYSGGQTSIHRVAITGTEDPDLYAGERYGNFSYAIPADTRDLYSVTVHLAEAYWGGPLDQTHGGPGSRLFNVDCNGVRLLENFDIYKQAGGGFRALTKTFHRLKPNAQGKLVLSFEPVENYASLYALEVEDEGR